MSDEFLDLGSLADSLSDVVELCAANFTLTDNFNLSYVGRMEGEGLFNTASVCYAANCECFGDTAAVTSDNCSLIHLDSFTGTFFDTVVYANCVADVEEGTVSFSCSLAKTSSLFICYSSFLES